MTNRKPGIYISTLYFAEGLPYTIVKMISIVFFKNFGASNEFIGLTSNLLTIPWTVKPFWSVLVDIYWTKRDWIIKAELVLCLLTALLACACRFVPAGAAFILALIALASATHDIAVDGYYLDVLSKHDQALFVGVRNTAYKIAWLFGAGGLVFLAGTTGSPAAGWSTAFALSAVIFIFAFFFHSFYLPQPAALASTARKTGLDWPVFKRAFASYFAQKGIAAIVVYILIFRAGDALMLSMAQPFLLDEAKYGGLAISTQQVGIIYGTVGMLALLAGGIFGGILLSGGGLKRWLWPTALLQNSAILLYWCLAVLKPAIAWVYTANAIEQFAYGLGVSAYTVFLLRTVKPEFKAAHYAIATGMMAIGLLIPGAASGFLTHALGYGNFFALSFLASIPGLITIFFLPLELMEPE